MGTNANMINIHSNMVGTAQNFSQNQDHIQF